MNLGTDDGGVAQPFGTSSATAFHPLGTRRADKFGNIFRYAKAGAVDLAAGAVVQSSVFVAGHSALAVNTTSNVGIGATAIAITCASTAAAGFYNDGFAAIASGAGQGYKYYIASHPAVSTGATGVFTFYNEDALLVALTTTSTVTLFANKYANVLVVPVTTATGIVLGVAPYVITAAQYGWIQTWGLCVALTEGTPALGQWMNGIAATSGRVAAMSSPAVTGNSIIGQPTAVMGQLGVAGQYCIVDLRVSP